MLDGHWHGFGSLLSDGLFILLFVFVRVFIAIREEHILLCCLLFGSCRRFCCKVVMVHISVEGDTTHAFRSWCCLGLPNWHRAHRPGSAANRIWIDHGSQLSNRLPPFVLGGIFLLLDRWSINLLGRRLLNLNRRWLNNFSLSYVLRGARAGHRLSGCWLRGLLLRLWLLFLDFGIAVVIIVPAVHIHESHVCLLLLHWLGGLGSGRVWNLRAQRDVGLSLVFQGTGGLLLLH